MNPADLRPDRPISTILVLGGTGRTGRRVVKQLLSRGVRVRAIVRSDQRLPAECVGHAGLEVIEACLLELGHEALRRYVLGCQAVISCLGHVSSPKGVFGSPRGLVTRAAQMIFDTAGTLDWAQPLRFVLMSSVSVNHPGGLEPRRSLLERAALLALGVLVPPARDNQQAADFLYREVGPANPDMEWVVLRPDTLVEGDLSAYGLHESLVSTVFRPDKTAMSNVAHFMCEMACDSRVWQAWKGRFPVIVDAAG